MLKPYPPPAVFKDHEMADYDLTGYLSYRLFRKYEGLKFTERGETLFSRIVDCEPIPKNAITLVISDAKTDAMAIHSYGKLHLPPIRYFSENGAQHLFLMNALQPLERVKLHHILTKEEMEEHPRHFEGHRAGENFHGFQTENDVRTRAIEVVSTYFPGFVLIERDSIFSADPIRENEWLMREPAKVPGHEKNTARRTSKKQQLSLF